ncbi:uncharacterized protein LOC106013374 [Aplysia californica]|uniref:Uncharacterized protein LOC106013374 n=1 Tax=Aplysia californica TaxID=6500 RepID=A0ABM1AB76_APLCA|nr:uncharacterized protein LOC106013374 [Aplysia californica]
MSSDLFFDETGSPPTSQYQNYLFCAQDVACSCDLLQDGTSKTSELTHRRVARIMYQLFSGQCTEVNVPDILLRPGFECFDPVTALPFPTTEVKLSYAQAIIFGNHYFRQNMSEGLYQCSLKSLCDCGLATSASATSFLTSLVDMHGQCEMVSALGPSDCSQAGGGGGAGSPSDCLLPPCDDVMSDVTGATRPDGTTKRMLSPGSGSGVGGGSAAGQEGKAGENGGQSPTRAAVQLSVTAGMLVSLMTCNWIL